MHVLEWHIPFERALVELNIQQILLFKVLKARVIVIRRYIYNYI